MVLVKILAALALGLALTGCGGPSSRELTEARTNRAKILSLISVGESFDQAEAKLKNAGFKFVYPKPIDPTGRGEYLQQLVVIHPALIKPGTQSSFAYTIGIKAPKTAPYIILEANSEGLITKLQ
jgi:hypothetical protein